MLLANLRSIHLCPNVFIFSPTILASAQHVHLINIGKWCLIETGALGMPTATASAPTAQFATMLCHALLIVFAKVMSVLLKCQTFHNNGLFLRPARLCAMTATSMPQIKWYMYGSKARAASSWRIAVLLLKGALITSFMFLGKSKLFQHLRKSFLGTL